MKVTFPDGASAALLRFEQGTQRGLAQKIFHYSWIGFLLLISGISGFLISREHHWALGILAFVVLFTLTYSVMWGVEYLTKALPRWIFSKISAKSPKGRMQSVTLLNEGILHERAGRSNILKWQDIDSLKQEKQFIYFKLENRQSLIIPTQAFLNPEQGEVFYNMAQNLWQAGRPITGYSSRY